MILLLLIPVVALFLFVTRSLLTASVAEKRLGRAIALSAGLFVGATFLALGIAWFVEQLGGSGVLGWWNQAWRDGDDRVLLISGLHASILPLIPMLTMWRLYRSGQEIKSLDVNLEFPINLFIDEKSQRRRIALLLAFISAIAFVALSSVTVTAAADLVLGTSISNVGTSTLESVNVGWSFIEDLMLILGTLFSLVVVSMVVWSGITEDRTTLVGLAIFFGLFILFAWVTGRLEEVRDYMVGPFERMFERLFG